MSQTKEWNTQIFQVVCVVKDVEKTLENWKTMVEFNHESIETGKTGEEAQCVYKGEKIQCPTKYAIFELGGIQIKLVEPLNKEGGDPYSDKLLKCGQGFHHIGFYAQEYDGLLKLYADRGLKPVYEETLDGKTLRLFDFEGKTGMSVAPWEGMTGPCARM